jgi:hypothetical protein
VRERPEDVVEILNHMVDRTVPSPNCQPLG